MLSQHFQQLSYLAKNRARQRNLRADTIVALSRYSVLSQSFLLSRPTQSESLLTITTFPACIASGIAHNCGLPAWFYFGLTLVLLSNPMLLN